jgi:hypothetical protein
MDFQFSAQLAQSFSHSDEPNAEALNIVRALAGSESLDNARRHASAIIFDA